MSLGTKSGGCADVIVVCALDMWELSIHVSLLFVADHGEHESYGVVDTFDIDVGARVVGAGDNRIGAEAVVEGGGRFGDRCHGRADLVDTGETRVGRGGGGGVVNLPADLHENVACAVGCLPLL